MNTHVHLAIPPNIARHIRSEFAKRFPGLSIGAPDIHMEMYQTAATCGAMQPPALTVSAYPQLIDNILQYGASSFSIPNRPLPPLRSELAALGMTPPSPLITIVSVVPCVLTCNNSSAAEVQDWEDLCGDKLKGTFATPPFDTPLPYLFSTFMSHTFGAGSDRMLEGIDTTSTPLDINKRVDAGDLAAGLLIPAFGRSYRKQNARMVWPRSGALAVPLIATLTADAPDEAHEALTYLLLAEVQSYFSLQGGLVPVIDDVAGFPELEATGWQLLWPGWEMLHSVADTMTAHILSATQH